MIQTRLFRTSPENLCRLPWAGETLAHRDVGQEARGGKEEKAPPGGTVACPEAPRSLQETCRLQELMGAGKPEDFALIFSSWRLLRSHREQDREAASKHNRKTRVNSHL